VLTLLHEVFKIHPLAVEDVREFHQRPKIMFRRRGWMGKKS
jgi:Mg2+ and Co2+ transporter CorA